MKLSTFSLIFTISSSVSLIAAVPLGSSHFAEISERGTADLSDWHAFGREENDVFIRGPTEWQLSHRDLELRQPNPKPIDIKQWQKQDRGVKVDKFIATAVKMPGVFDPKNPTKQLIHWRGAGAYKISGQPRSTSLDTRKLSANDPEVEVQLISKPFAVSSQAPYHWEANFVKDYTTTQLYELLEQEKFNQYMYNGEGSGCLTWTTALVKLLEDNGILAKGSKDAFLQVVSNVRNDPKYWVPDEPGAEFY